MIDPGPWGAVARALPGLLSELHREEAALRPLVVSGAAHPAEELRAALEEGGESGLVVTLPAPELARPELSGAAAVVYVVERALSPSDEVALRGLDRAAVPVVALVLGSGSGPAPILPHVLATDVVVAGSVDGSAVRAVARRVARRAPDEAWALAVHLPALRTAFSHALVSRAARQNALLAATSGASHADIVPLTLAQARMLARAVGIERGESPAGAVLAGVLVACAGTGLLGRAVSRAMLHVMPGARAAVDAAIAYGGTRALGLTTGPVSRRAA